MTVDSDRPYVNLRQWWLPPGTETVVPTKKGICLMPEVWQKLTEVTKQVEDMVPAVKDGIPCGLRDDHSNQEGLLRCLHCSPNTYQDWLAMA